MYGSEFFKLHKSSRKDTPKYLTLSPSNSNSLKEDDDINIYKNKIEEQRKIISQYESWLSNLTELIENTEYNEYSLQILNGLEKIYYLNTENESLKHSLSAEVKKKEELAKQIINLKMDIMKKKEEINDKNLIEKVQLIDSISLLSDELEHLSEKNVKYKSLSSCNIDTQLSLQLDQLKSENSELKQLIKFESNRENNNMFIQMSSSGDKSKFSTLRNENTSFSCYTLEPSQFKEEESLFMSFKKEK